MAKRLPPELLLKNLPPYWRDRERERRRKERATVTEFVEGAQAGDIERFAKALVTLGDSFDRGLWSRAMRAVVGIRCPDDFREWFLRGPYLRDGDMFRQEIDNDLLWVNALRSLLPIYSGPGLTVYRGEIAWNQWRRTYGSAWTVKEDVARSFALGTMQTCDGGSVLLSAFAPPDAIVCSPALLDDRYGEQEYVIDRRRLIAVRVLERFPQRPIAVPLKRRRR